MAILFFFTGFISCGPIAEETAHQKALKDSAQADSIMRGEAAKIKTFEMARKKFTDSVKASKIREQKALQDSTGDSLSHKNKAGNVLTPTRKTDSLTKSKHPRKDSLHHKKSSLSDSQHKRSRIRKDSVQ